jgi:hypothetical protein
MLSQQHSHFVEMIGAPTNSDSIWNTVLPGVSGSPRGRQRLVVLVSAYFAASPW